RTPRRADVPRHGGWPGKRGRRARSSDCARIAQSHLPESCNRDGDRVVQPPGGVGCVRRRLRCTRPRSRRTGRWLPHGRQPCRALERSRILIGRLLLPAPGGIVHGHQTDRAAVMSVRSSCLGCTAGRAVLIAAMIAAATSPAALAGCARESEGAQPGDALPSDSVLEPDGARGLDDIHQSDRVPAFPGAEGFGAFARGGRGGDVLFVTNLDDYQADESPIEGSLRLAIEAEGPRTVLFRVSG